MFTENGFRIEVGLFSFGALNKIKHMNNTEILLFAFSVNLGIALGAGLYEIRIVLPLWFHLQKNKNYRVDFEAMRKIDTGRKFWSFITTIPLTLLTIANLYFAFHTKAPLYSWWMTATFIILIERIGTFAFFIPTAIKLQKGEELSVSKTKRLVLWWIRLNYVRNALTFAALLISLKALMIV